jgi:hypothetical protein
MMLYVFKWLYKLSKRFSKEMDEFEYQCEMKSFGRLEKLDQRISEFLERNDRIISVKRVELRSFYDSTWEVRILLDGQIVERRIVRRDVEHYLDFATELLKVDSIEALKALDERDKIYYD